MFHFNIFAFKKHQASDDDKEKGEGALPTGKSKKKKKKKKKQGEDNSPAQVEYHNSRHHSLST